MQIEDGKGTGYKAEVDTTNLLLTRAITESHAAHISFVDGETYMTECIDAGPVADEYTFYIKNDSDSELIIDELKCFVTDADVVWKLWRVTGTAAGAAVITPQNLNLNSGHDADVTCRGGAGGVTGLTTSGNVIWTWKTGIALSHYEIDFGGRLILGKNDTLAIEYDAGTGGLVHLNMFFHFHE
jgi:hypothetical protein